MGVTPISGAETPAYRPYRRISLPRYRPGPRLRTYPEHALSGHSPADHVKGTLIDVLLRRLQPHFNKIKRMACTHACKISQPASPNHAQEDENAPLTTAQIPPTPPATSERNPAMDCFLVAPISAAAAGIGVDFELIFRSATSGGFYWS